MTIVIVALLAILSVLLQVVVTVLCQLSVSSLQSDDDNDAPVLTDVDSHYGNHPIPELEQRYGPIALFSILSICICKLFRYLR